ncbi:BatA domain-containing protein [Lutibacter sp.]|uniref:BatA domain-containing protein n=1 Tax=Lutibacter sp. TaxID=1925666 RepID=UPI001A32D404|nr:BatA domain-containing protein [Lutibacter sp.]MBI9041211.1 BatA domain-containing protein [Lutibacter sp.]
MQFKHPEILYALALLIIPILVHLFQLQRFEKIPFTNVHFLKNIIQQTRKSSKLKKFLILLTRMAAFTCLIFAFAQPYFSDNSLQQNFSTTIFLDNSFSMQAKGESGELLKTLAQQIIENTNSKNSKFSLITNDHEFINIDEKTLKNELISCEYSTNRLDLNTILLKLNSLNSKLTNTLNKNIILSDFQFFKTDDKLNFTNVNSAVNLVKAVPKKFTNIFIDSIYTSNENTSEIVLSIVVKSTKNSERSYPISLLNGSKLIGKSTAKFNNSNSTIVQFTIPNTSNFKGTILLVNDDLEFDNSFYFTISKPEKINVFCIGENAPFLNKIYTKNEFNFTSNQLQNLNYNILKSQHLIIINELENIPIELSKSLNEFSKNGGTIVVIPSNNSNINSYNSFFNEFNIGKISTKIEEDHKVTSIVYEHPLLKNVFENKVTNFQYPNTSTYYKSQFKNHAPILKLDSNEPFITSINGSLYWIASPLNKETSNFTQSSLIVPIFYNFAKNSLRSAELYYTIQTENTIEILTTIEKDNVLKIASETSEFIPLQEISQNKVTLKMDSANLKSGFYTVKTNTNTIKTIAFNYNREESNLNYLELEPLIKNAENVSISSNLDNFFDEIYNDQKINWLFKWFLAFSVLFLLIEMLLLKYFKI